MDVLRFILLASLYTWNFSSNKMGRMLQKFMRKRSKYTTEDDKEISKQYKVWPQGGIKISKCINQKLTNVISKVGIMDSFKDSFNILFACCIFWYYKNHTGI